MFRPRRSTRSTASCLFLTRNAAWPSRSRWTRNVGKPRGLFFVGSEPADFPGFGDFRRRSTLVSKLAASGLIRDFDFGMGNGTGFGASVADFRLFFNESRKPTKSGRSPLATFYVRLLREGRRLRQGDKLRDAPIPIINPRPSAEGGFLVFDLDQGFPESNGEPRAGRSPLPEWYYGR